MHQRENQYLLRPHQHPFELNNKPELALHYPNHIPTPEYALFQPQTLVPNHHKSADAYDYSALPPSDTSPVMVKQLMSNPRDCESGSESLRYQTATACESGLEVGTCDPGAHQMVAAGRDDQGINDWTMLDRLVTSHDLANEDSSKGVRFEDANATSVHQINQLSLRGEMNFWGYEK